MIEGKLYTMKEFRRKYQKKDERVTTFIERVFVNIGKSKAQLYRDINKSNIRVFTNGKTIKILLEPKRE